MSDESELLKARTMKFALDVCRLIRKLPHGEPGPTARRQLAKASTGMAFNYRASCRARSHAEFTARLGVVSEEADESQGWLEFVHAANLVPTREVSSLFREATELSAIFAASVGTARSKERDKRR
jgi:four helix bundle protein